MQSLASRSCSQHAVSCRRNAAARPSVARAFAQPRYTRQARRELRLARAAEDTATATADASTSEQPAEEEQLSAMQRARRALESDETDKAVLESALAELDAEMARMQESVAAAESRAAMLEGTVSTAKDQLLRLNADFDNFRRRSKDEKDAVADNVKGDVVMQLLPLIDAFEMARTQVKVETEGEQKINNSYQGMYKQLVDIMRGLGIEAVPGTGAPFDPNVHEAIMREPNEEVEDGTVLQEFRKGFKIGDKLLRPAMVKVSVKEGAPVSSSEE